MKFKWCIKFLDSLKQLLFGQDINPPSFLSQLSLDPSRSQKELHPASPPLPSATGPPGKQSPSQVPPASYKSVLPKNTLPWRVVEPEICQGCTQVPFCSELCPMLGQKQLWVQQACI